MKQTTKRFYGTLACVAVLSGLTGAFASPQYSEEHSC